MLEFVVSACWSAVTAGAGNKDRSSHQIWALMSLERIALWKRGVVEKKFKPGGKNNGGQQAMQRGERSKEEEEKAVKYLWAGRGRSGEIEPAAAVLGFTCLDLFGVVGEDKKKLVENVGQGT
jgi:hypothetical protein